MQVVITVHGDVQGVFYRSEAQTKAVALGIVGYARNNADGTVTICAQGQSEKVEEFIEWCRKGPSFAKVQDVTTEYQDPDQQFTRFEIY